MNKLLKKIALCFTFLALIGGAFTFASNFNPSSVSAVSDETVDESKLRTIIFDHDHNHFPSSSVGSNCYAKNDLGENVQYYCNTNATITSSRGGTNFDSENDWSYVFYLMIENIYDFRLEIKDSVRTEITYIENNLFCNSESKTEVYEFSETASISNFYFSICPASVKQHNRRIGSLTIRYLERDPKFDNSNIRTITMDYNNNHFPESSESNVILKDDIGQDVYADCTNTGIVVNSEDSIKFSGNKKFFYDLDFELDTVCEVIALSKSTTNLTRADIKYYENNIRIVYSFLSKMNCVACKDYLFKDLEFSVSGDILEDVNILCLIVRYVDSGNDGTTVRCGVKANWQEWTDGSKLPTAGYYYLGNEIIGMASSTNLTLTGDLYLDLNGKTINCSYQCYDIGSNKLDLYDSVGNGKIQRQSGATIGGSISLSNDSSVFNMHGGTIDGVISLPTLALGSVYVKNGVFNMYGGTIQNCSSSEGGGVYVENGAFNMYGGTIQNCSSSEGGGVYVKSGTFNMYRGTIINCSAEVFGGGINVNEQGASLTISGGYIGKNISALGSGIYSQSNKSTNFSGRFSTENGYDPKISGSSTITFDPNGGKDGAETLDATWGANLNDGGNPISVPVRDNYTFAGYYNAPTGGDKYFNADGTVTTRTGDEQKWDYIGPVTLYAHWVGIPYTVSYEPGSFGTGSTQTDSKEYGTPLTLKGEIFTRTGYKQVGWSTSDGGEKAYELNDSYIDNAEIVLYPVWEIQTYTISYNKGTYGSGENTSETKTHGVTLTLKGEIYTRAGYSQIGWSTSDGGEKAYELNGSYTDNAGITLYPCWKADTYTVSYNKGSNGVGENTTDTKTYDVSLTLKGEIFTRTGYKQVGWSTSDGGEKVYELNGSYTDNAGITLYPYWKADTYTVSYNKGSNGVGENTTDTKTHDVSLTLKGAIFTRSGCKQVGWSTTDGGKKVYELNGSYTENAATTLYPVWQEDIITISYNKGAYGTGVNTSEIKTYGIPLKLKGVLFTREGFRQEGWATSDGGEKVYENNGIYTGNESVTLYPAWARQKFTIGYFPGSGVSGSVQYGAKEFDIPLTLAGETFFKVGYTQTGWSTSDGGPKVFDLEGTYTENVAAMLYPFWTANTYTVTYNPGAYGLGLHATAVKTHDVDLTLSGAIFTRDDYKQTGWATSDGGEKAYDLNGTYTSNKPIALYPVWTLAEKHSVSYVANGASGDVPTQSDVGETGIFTVASATGLTKEHFAFAGWSDGTTTYQPGEIYTMGTENVTFTAQWTPIMHSVTYSAGEGSGTVPTQVDVAETGTFVVAENNGLTKDHYTFAGWSDGTNTYQPGATYTVGSSNVTLTAQWTPIMHSITYSAGEGSGTVPTQVDVAETGTFVVAEPTELIKDHYTFAGWSDGTTTYQPGATYTVGSSNITLTAQWTPIMHSVTYSAGEGSGIVPTQADVGETGTFTVASATGLTKEHFAFAGWSDGTSTYQPGEIYTMGTENVTFTAQWTPIMHSITYSAGEGSGTVPTQVDVAETGTFVVAEPTELTKDHYTFIGWSDGTTTYQPGATYTVGSSNVTLTAQWTANKYAVTFVGNDSDSWTPEVINQTYGQTYILPVDEPTKVGYHFVGWFTEETGGTKITSTSIVNLSGAQTLYAHYEIDVYSVSTNVGHFKSQNEITELSYGSSYNNTFTADEGWSIESITYTIEGSEPVTVQGNTLSLESVTKNLTITVNVIQAKTPTEPEENFNKETTDKIKDFFGSSGFIISASVIVSLASLAGVSLLIFKKKKR